MCNDIYRSVSDRANEAGLWPVTEACTCGGFGLVLALYPSRQLAIEAVAEFDELKTHRAKDYAIAAVLERRPCTRFFAGEWQQVRPSRRKQRRTARAMDILKGVTG